MTQRTDTTRRMARFGCFELDLDSAEITRRGIPIRLQPQPASVLVLLVEHAGRLVTHETIQHHIGWSVAADQTIHTSISQLRKTLGDPAKSPAFIETVPRRGYRFIAPVHLPGQEVNSRGKRYLTLRSVLPSFRVAAIVVLVAAAALLIGTVDESTAPVTAGSVTQPSRPPANRAAVVAYLKGRYLLQEGGPESLARSRDLFQQAVSLDTRYAPAHIGLAQALWQSVVQGEPDNSAWALEEVKLGLRLDPSLSEGHLLLGRLRTGYRRDLAGAGESFARAAALDPGSATTRGAYAMHLTRMGRHAEAILQLEEAIRIDPVSAGVRGDAGMTYFLAGEFERAREQCAVAVELRPEDVPSYWCLMRVYQQLDRPEEALSQAFAIMKILGLPPAAIASFEQLPVSEALHEFWRDQAVWFTREIELGRRRQYLLAVTYGTLGERDLALEWLGRAVTAGVPAVTMMKVEPAFEALRSDRRFAELLAEVGLEEQRG